MTTFRRVLTVLLVAATALVALAAVLVVVSQTPWFRGWLRGLIVRQAYQYLNGTLSIGGVGGNLFYGIELNDVRLRAGGERVVSVQKAAVDYDPLQLVSGDIVIDRIRLEQPVVALERTREGWNVGSLVKRQEREQQRTGPGRSITLKDISVSDGRISVRQAAGTSGGAAVIPGVIDNLDVRAGFEYAPVHYTASIGHVSFDARNPDFSLEELSGTVSTRDDDLYLNDLVVKTPESSVQVDGRVVDYLGTPVAELTASSRGLDLGEVGKLVPALAGMELKPSFRVAANGPLDQLGVDFEVRSSAGDARGRVTANVAAPAPRVSGMVRMNGLDLAPLTRTPAAKSDLTGAARIDMAFPPGEAGPAVGTFDASLERAEVAGYAATGVEAKGRVDGARVTLQEASGAAYGAHATVAGLIVSPSSEQRRPLRMDLRGAVSNLDLRRLPPSLPVPAVESDLDLYYRLEGSLESLRGWAELRRSTLAGASLAQGTTASFTRDGEAVGYGARGYVSNLDLQRVGRAFEIQALSGDRYASDVNARFAVEGRGTSLPELVLDATASLENSSVSVARLPDAELEAHVENGGVRVTADGQFAGIDPGRLAGREDLAGDLSGRADVEARIPDVSAPVTMDWLSASGRVELSPSKVGPISLQGAVIDGAYDNRVARFDTLTLNGEALEAEASGAVVLADQGASDLKYHVEVRDLAPIGRLTGQPLEGSVAIDGAVTGNGDDLRTSGKLKGTRLAYADNRALGAESDYEAELPDLRLADARVTANTRLTFLTVAGEELTSLQARTALSGNQLQFDADVQQTIRQASVSGRLVLHPDHKEVHLARFAFSTQGTEWTLPPGGEAAIEYGGERILVEGLTLVSGEQRIEVEGTIGKAKSGMNASLRNVDVSKLDAWLVGDRRLGGTLDASARVTGPRDDLDVRTEFSIEDGSFEDFQYNSLSGTAGYTGREVSVDARLQQGPGTWLVARGTVPTALFAAAPAGGAARPGADDPVDLTIQSSSIDLGLVQGFTTLVNDVSGTLRTDVRVSGTAAAPRLGGFVEVSGGAFEVPASGVAYTQLDGRVALQGDRAVFERLSLTDEHGRRLSLTGEVAAAREGLGDLQATLRANRFELLHNDLGRLAVDANLRIGGRLQAPVVEGQVTMQTAQVELDEWLQRLAVAAYSTTPTKPAPGVAGAESPAAAAPVGAPAAPAARTLAPVPPLGGTPAGARQAAGTPAGKAGAVPGTAEGQAAAPAGPYEAARLDVTVRIPDVLIVRGDNIRPPGGSPVGMGDVNITLGGSVRVQKAAGGEPEMVGTVRTVRGTYDFQGRRFDLQRDSSIEFQGLTPIDPALDLTATRVISGVEARVHVGGTMREPVLTLSSQPPLDEADILSLIVFNQPANQLGAGEQVSLAQRASALATGFVASKLADSLGRALDLDIFEIQAAPAGEQGASVTVGEQVGQRLFLRLRQGVGAETSRQFIMEYQLLDFLRLETTVSQGGTATRSLMRRVEGSGLDLIFFFNY